MLPRLGIVEKIEGSWMVSNSLWPQGNDWTADYPEKYRTILELCGVNNPIDPRAEQFNRNLIEIADYSQGKDRWVFKCLYEDLCADYGALWGDSLERWEWGYDDDMWDYDFK